MTTQHVEIPETTFDLAKGSSGEVLITASDPGQPGRTASFVAHNSLTSGGSFGFGPVFTMEVVRQTGLA